MSIIFQNNTISITQGTLFSEVAFAGWRVNTNAHVDSVTTAVRMVDVRKRDGSRSVYTVPTESHAILPEHAEIIISGPYIEHDGDAKFEYMVLRNPRMPGKVLAILVKEISTRAMKAAFQSTTVCDKCGNGCAARP